MKAPQYYVLWTLPVLLISPKFPHQPSTHPTWTSRWMKTGISFTGDKAAEAWSWLLNLSRAAVTNEWDYYSIPPHTFMVCLQTTLLLLCSFFWVIPLRVNFMCRRFDTLCLFHLSRWCKQEEHTKFRLRGITQEKEYNISSTAKFWNKKLNL